KVLNAENQKRLLVAGQIASVLGLASAHALTAIAGHVLEARQSIAISGAVWLPGEAWIPFAAVVVAMLAALIPIMSAYRMDVAQLLNGR
ncbi:MAG: hypothetical protein V4787_08035, partial [Pseudomonadota bacterium]